MSASKERVSPSGPTVGVKTQLEIQHDTIPAQGTVQATAALPPNSAQIHDSVEVNPAGPLLSGVVIGATRISTPDTLEVTFGNLTAMAVDHGSVVIDVLVRRF
jgi:hypothetical protein